MEEFSLWGRGFINGFIMGKIPKYLKLLVSNVKKDLNIVGDIVVVIRMEPTEEDQIRFKGKIKGDTRGLIEIDHKKKKYDIFIYTYDMWVDRKSEIMETLIHEMVHIVVKDHGRRFNSVASVLFKKYV